MRFEISNTFVQVSDVTEEQNRLLSEYGTKEYEYYGLDYSRRPPRRAKKVAYLRYFQNGQFPSGWAGKFVERMEDLGHEVECVDLRRSPSAKNGEIRGNLPELRDYQWEAHDLAIERTRGIINHATGSGKSIIMAQILDTLKLPAIIVVPTLNLLMQNYRLLESYFGEAFVGRVGEGMFIPRMFTIATIQSLWSRFKQDDEALKKVIQACNILFIEEAHHIYVAGKNKIQNTYFQLAQTIDAYYRFGLTATPGEEGTLERELLEAATGRPLHHISSSELIKRGLLTRPTIKIYKVSSLFRIGDWQEAYRRNILQNEKRNRIIKNLAEKYSREGQSVLIIVNRVQDHGMVLDEMIEESVLMIGSTPTEERKEILEDFETKRQRVLISTVVNEGVDVPNMDTVIMAGGGKSSRAVIQRVGRALRRSPGKTVATIIDFYDDDRGILLKHSKARIKTYRQEEEFEVQDYINEIESKPFWEI